MSLVILQALGLWLLAGGTFWAAFVVLGFRFSEARPLATDPYGTAGAAGAVGP